MKQATPLRGRGRTVALLTDFGTRDPYAGIMKGVMLGIAPGARLVDITHHIPPQDIRAAAYSLLVTHPHFPADTVFCCVVDPGVGSARHAVAVELTTENGGRQHIVCPDNGLLTPLLPKVTSAVLLDDPRYHLPNPSATFHGRDIFAPAAAHLAAGVPMHDLGTTAKPSSLVRLDWPAPTRTPEGWRAIVLHIDHFGNLITSLPGGMLPPPRDSWRFEVAGRQLDGLGRTFTDAAPGQPVAYVGSSGLLEVALRQGNAQQAWQVERGSEVVATRLSRRT
ncbi:MAG TPA: SAM-dependent chlorinase/fluorinase, partial [Trueperaceae bacterium]